MLTGLEAQRHGSEVWLPVQARACDILVFVGETMEHWTSGNVPALVHQVALNTGPDERYSCSFFVNGAEETIYAPPPDLGAAESTKAVKFDYSEYTIT